jgi:hypothetical protein
MRRSFNPGENHKDSTIEPNPIFWDDHTKLAHSMRMAEKLIDSHPHLAEVWLKSSDLIRTRIASMTSDPIKTGSI